MSELSIKILDWEIKLTVHIICSQYQFATDWHDIVFDTRNECT